MNVLIIISCICFLFIIGRIFVVPLKWIFKLIINSILGAVIIYIINLIGLFYNFHIGLNFFTAVLIRNFRNTWKCFIDIDKIFIIKNPRRITFVIFLGFEGYVSVAIGVHVEQMLHLFLSGFVIGKRAILIVRRELAPKHTLKLTCAFEEVAVEKKVDCTEQVMFGVFCVGNTEIIASLVLNKSHY